MCSMDPDTCAKDIAYFHSWECAEILPSVEEVNLANIVRNFIFPLQTAIILIVGLKIKLIIQFQLFFKLCMLKGRHESNDFYRGQEQFDLESYF